MKGDFSMATWGVHAGHVHGHSVPIAEGELCVE